MRITRWRHTGQCRGFPNPIENVIQHDRPGDIHRGVPDAWLGNCHAFACIERRSDAALCGLDGGGLCMGHQVPLEQAEEQAARCMRAACAVHT